MGSLIIRIGRVTVILLMVCTGFARFAAAVELTGFAQAHAALRTTHVDCTPRLECDEPFVNEQRLRLKAEGANDAGSVAFEAKLDLIHDAALVDADADVRELYGDYFSEHFTLRAGRQIITWGVGDLLFINDVFPKSWVSFFSGLPIEYLKRGSDAVKLDVYAGASAFSVVVSDFRDDELPAGRQFAVPLRPLPALPHDIDEPAGLELALRASRPLGGWDAALYASRNHYRAPTLVARVTEIRGHYPRLNTLGASLSGAFASGVLNIEAGYYDSEDDRGGTDPGIENSQTRLFVGYSRQVAQDTTVGAQAYGEWMHEYAAYKQTLTAGFARRDRVRMVVTLRGTQHFWHETLTINLFAFLGVSDEDTYVIPSVHYAFNDNLWAEVGANIFIGERIGQFGALGDNDNVYLSLRYAF